jgi:hypothetical protein
MSAHDLAWKRLDEGFGGLLLLLSQRASHEVLVQKVESLYRETRGICQTKKITRRELGRGQRTLDYSVLLSP